MTSSGTMNLWWRSCRRSTLLRLGFLGPISRAPWTTQFSSGGPLMKRCRFGLTRVTCSLRTIPLLSSGFPLNGASLANTPPLNKCFGMGFGCPGVEVDDTGVRVLAELAPHTSQTFSVLYRSDQATHRDLGFRWNAKAFVRRRLSEVRDNYLSRNQYVLTAAKRLRHRFLD